MKEFLTAWAILLFLNQAFVFGCFKVYCLIAGLPLTGIVAFLYVLFLAKTSAEKDEDTTVKFTPHKYKEVTQEVSNEIDTDKIFKDAEEKVRIARVEAKKKQRLKEQEKNKEKDYLKHKGDLYEKYIGTQFERKGELVIYNGFIRGYEDDGVDLISICTNTKSIHLIQCKNWTRKPILLEDIKKIYLKLSNFNLHRVSHKALEIQKYQGEFRSTANIKHVLSLNKSDYTIRKTLYVSSDKVVDLNIGKYLKLIKPTIFKYHDMKIVIKKINS